MKISQETLRDSNCIQG